jgi:hypothetical protein
MRTLTLMAEGGTAQNGADMFINSTDIQIYPKSAKLLHGLETTLDPKIRKAFFEACLAPDQNKPPAVAKRLAQEALRAKAGPRVDVAQGMVRATALGEVVDGCGYHPPFGAAKVLIITSFWFDAYEFGIDRQKAAERLIRTVLHEAVHWVRHHAQASDDVIFGGHYKGTYEEAGHAFEQMAYGDANVCTDAQLLDAMTSIAPSGEREMLKAKAILNAPPVSSAKP